MLIVVILSAAVCLLSCGAELAAAFLDHIAGEAPTFHPDPYAWQVSAFRTPAQLAAEEVPEPRSLPYVVSILDLMSACEPETDDCYDYDSPPFHVDTDARLSPWSN